MIETGFNNTEIGKIGSAVVPTLIAQTWFQPEFKPLADEARGLEAAAAAREEP
jgi:hypothetical protein